LDANANRLPSGDHTTSNKKDDGGALNVSGAWPPAPATTMSVWFCAVVVCHITFERSGDGMGASPWPRSRTAPVAKSSASSSGAALVGRVTM
jgi:hypothetical protein